MTGNSNRKSFAAKTARLLVLLVAVCMVLTVFPSLTDGFLPKASAAGTTIQSSSVTEINNALNSSSGEVDVLLTGDVYLSEGIVIPSGRTVNFYMNGKSMNRTDLNSYTLSGFYAITNNGTLNLYSGSPAQPVLTNGNAGISLTNSRTGMNRDEVNEQAYADLAAVKNSGTLTVNKGIVMTVSNSVGFSRDGDNKNNNSVNVGATGVYNTSNSASVVLNGVQITCSTYSCTLNANAIVHTKRPGSARSLSYGVYGGRITVNGACNFSTTCEVRGDEGASGSDVGSAKATAIAIDICSSQQIAVNGGEFTYRTKATHDHDGFKNATLRSFCAGIAYSTTPPVMTDGNIDYNVNDGYGKFDQVGRNETTTVFEAPVARLTTLPVSGYNVANDSVFRGEGYDYNLTGTNTAGQYNDESGNLYDSALSTTDESRPTKIVRGAPSGYYRVHVVYRYWTTSGKVAVDENIVGAGTGYSYKPLADGTNVVSSIVSLGGLSGDKLMKSKNNPISYLSGGQSKNDYYWKQFNIASYSTNDWFSDFDVTSVPGDVFKSFVNTTNGQVGGGAEYPIYIFADYYRVSRTAIKGEVGASNAASVVYTGSAIKASSFGLKIKKSATPFDDYTADYNIDFTPGSSKIPVNYVWTGTTAANASVSGEGELPVNAGTYEVTLIVADSSTYDPNDCNVETHKNRGAISYPFTLTISQAPALRGSLVESKTLTYGTKLNEALTLGSYVAKGVQNEDVPGVFAFASQQDGISYKQVGDGSVTIVWTPVYESGVQVKNYCETSFTVNYTVEHAPLVISPKAASVVYGNTEFDVPYDITVTGLVAGDNTDAQVEQIANAVSYEILVNGDYIVYDPDAVGAGQYDIRARVIQTSIPAVLSNYTYSYADIAEGFVVNKLTVTKRPLIVTATATSREYQPDNYNVEVSYEITEGRYSADDVRFNKGTGSVAENTAGTKAVGGVTKATAAECMTGTTSVNYKVEELRYATGASLEVVITKAIPTVTTPTVTSFYYQRTKTLANVALEGSTTSVAGSWTWADNTINPTVAVSTYTAKFIPEDNDNYDVKLVDVTVNVLPTPVTITYNGTVEYGDPSPNVTDYTFISDKDPSFSIDSVQTTGNIRFESAYTQGSPVNTEGYPVQFSLQNFVDSAGNYYFSVQDGRIRVTPRNIRFTVADQSIEYGENFVASAASIQYTYDAGRLVGTDTINSITSTGAEPTWNYSTTFRYSDNYSVGTYLLSIDPAFDCSPNYTVSVVNGTLTVTKAPLIIRANNVTLPYNSEKPANLSTAYNFINAKRNERLAAIVTSGAISVDTNYIKGSPVNAEGYPIVVDVSDAVIPNYNVTIENGTITVVKATPVIRTYPQASIVYGQTLADAVFAGEVIDDNVPGTFVYNASSTKPAYSNEPYNNYTATFVPDDSANYNSLTGLTISLTVRKMPVSGALAVTGIPMKTQTLTVDVSGMSPDEPGVYMFVWKMGDVQVGTGTSLELTEAHVGSVITVTAVAQGYYEGSVSYTTTAIAPELTDVATILNTDAYQNYFTLEGLDVFGGTKTVTYNADQHPVTLLQKQSTMASAIVGTITVKYNGSTEIPTNAGNYAITVDVATPDLSKVTWEGVTTYSPASGLPVGRLIIEKAPYNVTVTVADKVYDGFNAAAAGNIDESGAMTLAGGAKDDVAFDAARAVYTFADANVGTDKQVVAGNEALTGSAADNYVLNFSLANDAKADITPRTLNVRVEPVAREYQENYYDVDLSFVVDVTSIAPADTTASVYVNEALANGRVDDYHAGPRSVTVSGVELAGAKKDNYVLNLTNITGLSVEIEKAIPDYPLPYTGTNYYDSGRTLSNISLGDSRWAWADSVANLIPEAGTHNYTAVFTPDDEDNYAAVNYEVSLTIKKQPVVITATSMTTVYGDYAPTYTYTATGLTGTDTMKSSLGGFVIATCAYEPGYDVGEYPIVLSGGFTSNNYSFNYQNGTLSIVPRRTEVTAIAASRQYQEGNTSVTVTFSPLTNIYPGDGSSVSLAASEVTGTIADDKAGTKAVTYDLPSLSGAKANNYTLKVTNPDLTVVIEKAIIPGVILPTTGTVKYGAKLATTEFTSSFSGEDKGTFSMENPMSTPAAVGTTSDVYKVVFTPTDTINYATISDYITLTVVTSELNVELSLSGSAEVGKKLYVSTNNLPADAYNYIEFKWYRVENKSDDVRDGKLVDAGTSEYVVTEKDADHYIVCVATEKSNSPYEIDAKVCTENSVSKKSMSLWERLLKWFYKVIASITQLFGKMTG